MLLHKGTRELCTKRLKLRKYMLSDAIYMYKNYASDERVTRFLTWTPYKCIEDVESFLADRIAEYAYETMYHWAIELEGEIIGSISTTFIDEKNHSCEIGYCIGYDYWNKGFTSEALIAVIDFLFNEIGINRIMAKHDIENPASGKVMLKCNMTYEGTLRKHYLRFDGTYSDSLVYSILKSDFLPISGGITKQHEQ